MIYYKRFTRNSKEAFRNLLKFKSQFYKFQSLILRLNNPNIKKSIFRSKYNFSKNKKFQSKKLSFIVEFIYLISFLDYIYSKKERLAF